MLNWRKSDQLNASKLNAQVMCNDVKWQYFAHWTCTSPMIGHLSSKFNDFQENSFHFASAFAATFCSHVTAPSSAEWSRNTSPSANLVSGQDSTMWIIVCTLPHWHLSVGAMCHLCRLAAQQPCPVRNRTELHPATPVLGAQLAFHPMSFNSKNFIQDKRLWRRYAL